MDFNLKGYKGSSVTSLGFKSGKSSSFCGNYTSNTFGYAKWILVLINFFMWLRMTIMKLI